MHAGCSLTRGGVKAGVCAEHVVGAEVDLVAGEAEVTADGGFRVQLGDGVRLERGTRSCRGRARRSHKQTRRPLSLVICASLSPPPACQHGAPLG